MTVIFYKATYKKSTVSEETLQQNSARQIHFVNYENIPPEIKLKTHQELSTTAINLLLSEQELAIEGWDFDERSQLLYYIAHIDEDFLASKDIERVIEIITSNDKLALLNQSRNQVSPLNNAILSGQAGLVRALLANGANPNTESSQGFKPFEITLVSNCSTNKKIEIILALKRAGGNIDINDQIINRLVPHERPIIRAALQIINSEIPEQTTLEPQEDDLEPKPLLDFFQSTDVKDVPLFSSVITVYDKLLEDFIRVLLLCEEGLEVKENLSVELKFYSEVSIVYCQKIDSCKSLRPDHKTLLKTILDNHNKILDKLIAAADLNEERQKKIFIYLANNLPFLESRLHLLTFISKILTPEQKAELLQFEFVVGSEVIKLRPEEGGVFSSTKILRYELAQRGAIKKQLETWQPKLEANVVYDDSWLEEEPKKPEKTKKRPAKPPKKPTENKITSKEVEPKPVVMAPTSKPVVMAPEKKAPKPKKPKPPITQFSSPTTISQSSSGQSLLSLEQESLQDTRQSLRDKYLKELTDQRSFFKAAFDSLKADLDLSPKDEGGEAGLKRLQDQLGKLRDEIKERGKKFDESFKSFESTKTDLSQKLSISTQDIREKLATLSPSKTGVSGSAVYQPLLKSFPKTAHFSIDREPKDTDIFCVVETAKNRLLDEKTIGEFIQTNFGEEYEFDLKKVNIFPQDELPKASISFKLKHKETGQDFDINIYNQNHFRKLHQWQLGYDRLEFVWGNGEDGEFAANGLSQDFDEFIWQIYLEPEKFWQPNPQASKFVQRLLGGQGCLKTPDLSTLQFLRNAIGKDTIDSDWRKYNKNQESRGRTFCPEQQKILQVFGISHEPSPNPAPQKQKTTNLTPAHQQK